MLALTSLYKGRKEINDAFQSTRKLQNIGNCTKKIMKDTKNNPL